MLDQLCANKSFNKSHVYSTTASTPAAAPAASDVSSPDEFPAEVVNNLKALGFPDEAVKACLRASNGNPDVAVEFLMNGIATAAPVASNTGGGASSDSSVSSDDVLDNENVRNVLEMVTNKAKATAAAGK